MKSKGLYGGRGYPVTPSERRALDSRLRKVLDIFVRNDPDQILDIGCGDGNFTIMLKSACNARKAYGVEISAEGARKAKRMAPVLSALERIAGTEGFPEDAAKAKTELEALLKSAAADIAEAAGKVQDYIRAEGRNLREATRLEAGNTLGRLKEKWSGSEFERGYAELEVKMAGHEDALVRAKREGEAEQLRQRILRFFDAKAWSMVIIYSDKLLKEYPETDAARLLKEAKVPEHARQRLKEEADVNKAIERLKTRLRNLTMNRLYRDAVVAALQSQEYRQYGRHRRMQDFINGLKAKAAPE